MQTSRTGFRSIQLISVLAFLSAAAGVGPRGTVFARPTKLYTYGKLVSESDLVVIAVALETKDVTDQQLDDELEGLEDYVQCVTTSFQIEAVIKGDIRTDRLSVLHYRFKPGPPVVNGPVVVRFEHEGPVKADELLNGKPLRGPPPTYLLFLKRTHDRKFVPVSGQLDPDSSVNRIERADKDEQKVSLPLRKANPESRREK